MCICWIKNFGISRVSPHLNASVIRAIAPNFNDSGGWSAKQENFFALLNRLILIPRGEFRVTSLFTRLDCKLRECQIYRRAFNNDFNGCYFVHLINGSMFCTKKVVQKYAITQHMNNIMVWKCGTGKDYFRKRNDLLKSNFECKCEHRNLVLSSLVT